MFNSNINNEIFKSTYVSLELDGEHEEDIKVL